MASLSQKRLTRTSPSSSHMAKIAEISLWRSPMERPEPSTHKSVSFLVGVENSERRKWIVVEGSERLLSCLKHFTRERLKPYFLIKIIKYNALVAPPDWQLQNLEWLNSHFEIISFIQSLVLLVYSSLHPHSGCSSLANAPKSGMETTMFDSSDSVE